MSIFKSTLKDHIAAQIRARENLLSTDGQRPIQFQQYVSGKSPWVKMTSFVDFDDKIDLANYHILLGGALYPKSAKDTKEYSLRSGISVKGASYGSNLGTSQYGIRPMPGIESVSIRSLGAYGSLRESTIKYYAWDVKQLENLNILYMKPGYPVLLEWGWSMYLDGSNNVIKSDFETIDCFAPNISLEQVYDRIEALNIKYKGNYEGSLGLIKNYSYTMMPNGGFECTTTIISIGDVIGSLKMNSTSTKNPTPPTNTAGADVKDEFETLMTNLANKNNLGGVATPGGIVSQEFVDIDSNITNVAPITDIDTNVYTFGKAGYLDNMPDKDDRYTKFVQFAYLIHVLNNRTNIYTSKGNTLVKIEIPLPSIVSNRGNGLCVSSYNAMSIDNSVCVIHNPKATILDASFGFAPFVGRYAPGYVYPDLNNASSVTTFTTIGQQNIYGLSNPNIQTNTPQNQTFSCPLKPYLYGSTNLGIIGNIYVNIGKIISIYKSIHKENNGSVDLAQFLKALLSSIEYTLGSINTFDLYVDDNKCVIIDKHYVEDPANTAYGSKFNMNILGNNTTVREHKLVSKIFQEQATMMAIAAQDRENVAAMQTSTVVELNKNIYNRLYKNTVVKKTFDQSEEQNTILENITTLLSYVKSYIVTGESTAGQEITVTSLNTFLNQFIVVADRGTDYKGIIPLSLELTLDGIGGFTIGEIFTINKDILPLMYADKSVGFIITGINQSITRPDWTTTIVTQFCLLDQVGRQEESKRKSEEFLTSLKNYVDKSTANIKLSIQYYNMLVCFLHDFFWDQWEIVDYNTTGRSPYIGYRASGNAQYQKTVPYIKSYGIEGGDDLVVRTVLGSITRTGVNQKAFEVNPTSDNNILLSPFLDLRNSAPPPNAALSQGNVLLNTTTDNDPKPNVIKYLDYVIPNSKYYKEMVPEVQKIFDGTFDLVKNSFINRPGTWDKAVDIFKIVTALAGIGNITSGISSAISVYSDGAVSVNYLNEQAVDNFGNIIPSEIKLQQSIVIEVNKLYN